MKKNVLFYLFTNNIHGQSVNHTQSLFYALCKQRNGHQHYGLRITGITVLYCIIIITSHGENGSRPQRPLCPRNNDKVHFILHKILYYNTTVSDAMEICFVIIHHVLIDPEFI